MQNGSKYTEISLSPISRYSFALQVALGPRSPKLTIFVRTTTTTTIDIQNDCFTHCACVRGNYREKEISLDQGLELGEVESLDNAVKPKPEPELLILLKRLCMHM